MIMVYWGNSKLQICTFKYRGRSWRLGKKQLRSSEEAAETHHQLR